MHKIDADRKSLSIIGLSATFSSITLVSRGWLSLADSLRLGINPFFCLLLITLLAPDSFLRHREPILHATMAAQTIIIAPFFNPSMSLPGKVALPFFVPAFLITMAPALYLSAFSPMSNVLLFGQAALQHFLLYWNGGLYGTWIPWESARLYGLAQFLIGFVVPLCYNCHRTRAAKGTAGGDKGPRGEPSVSSEVYRRRAHVLRSVPSCSFKLHGIDPSSVDREAIVAIRKHVEKLASASRPQGPAGSTRVIVSVCDGCAFIGMEVMDFCVRGYRRSDMGDSEQPHSPALEGFEVSPEAILACLPPHVRDRVTAIVPVYGLKVQGSDPSQPTPVLDSLSPLVAPRTRGLSFTLQFSNLTPETCKWLAPVVYSAATGREIVGLTTTWAHPTPTTTTVVISLPEAHVPPALDVLRLGLKGLGSGLPSRDPNIPCGFIGMRNVPVLPAKAAAEMAAYPDQKDIASDMASCLTIVVNDAEESDQVVLDVLSDIVLVLKGRGGEAARWAEAELGEVAAHGYAALFSLRNRPPARPTMGPLLTLSDPELEVQAQRRLAKAYGLRDTLTSVSAPLLAFLAACYGFGPRPEAFFAWPKLLATSTRALHALVWLLCGEATYARWRAVLLCLMTLDNYYMAYQSLENQCIAVGSLDSFYRVGKLLITPIAVVNTSLILPAAVNPFIIAFGSAVMFYGIRATHSCAMRSIFPPHPILLAYLVPNCVAGALRYRLERAIRVVLLAESDSQDKSVHNSGTGAASSASSASSKLKAQ